MKPTYANLVPLFRADPMRRQREAASGLTCEQAAAMLLQDMARAPNPGARDRIFSQAMGQVGIFTTGVDAFDKGSEEILSRMESRGGAEKAAIRMSDESRKSPQYVSPERIMAFREMAAQSSLRQGLTARMRERDTRTSQHSPTDNIPDRPELRGSADDRGDRRASLMVAMAMHSNERGPYGGPWREQQEPEHTDDARMDRMRAHVGLRESLIEAMDMDDAWQQAADPLLDERLMSSTDAI